MKDGFLDVYVTYCHVFLDVMAMSWRQAKAGAKSSSGAWHLLVEALRAETAEATWAPGDSDEDAEKSHSASHQELQTLWLYTSVHLICNLL